MYHLNRFYMYNLVARSPFAFLSSLIFMSNTPLPVYTTFCRCIHPLMDTGAASAFCLAIVFERRGPSVRSSGDQKNSPVPTFRGFTIPRKGQSTNPGKSKSWCRSCRLGDICSRRVTGAWVWICRNGWVGESVLYSEDPRVGSPGSNLALSLAVHVALEQDSTVEPLEASVSSDVKWGSSYFPHGVLGEV